VRPESLIASAGYRAKDAAIDKRKQSSMTIVDFTPMPALIGGVLIGVSAILLMATVGRIAGISGFIVRLLVPPSWNDAAQSLLFLAGLGGATFLWTALSGAPIAHTVTSETPLLVAGGALVGFGSVWGNGCTSGHGVCGLSRFSLRSLVAVAVFMAVAVLTVWLVRHGGLA